MNNSFNNSDSLLFKVVTYFLFPLSIITVITLGVIFLVSNRSVEDSGTNLNVVSIPVESILPIQKGELDTQQRDASNPNSISISGNALELSNGWVHTQKFIGLKDTNFISNIIQVDATTKTNGDAAEVFVVEKNEYKFYISNQFITEGNNFNSDGILMSEIIFPSFYPSGVYLSYSSTSIFSPEEENQEYQARKQLFMCNPQIDNLCFASGYLPLEKLENEKSVQAFKEFLNSVRIN